MSRETNTLIESIAALCAREPLKEKLVIAPSNRVGNQWLDRVALSGGRVLNASVRTLRGLALELSAPVMVERGLRLAGGTREEVLVGRAFARLSSPDPYLAGLDPGPGLTRTLTAAVRDLRLAGIDGAVVDAGAFEVRSKGIEIAALLSAFSAELEAGGYTDYAGALALAIERLASAGLPPGVFVAVPSDLMSRARGLERDLLSAVPENGLEVLDVDPPHDPDAPLSLPYMLSFAVHPGSAPEPAGGGNVSMFRAVGEVNEVREVLRRCVADGVPFDDVEILYTDSTTYLPLIYEIGSRLGPGGADSLPFTFLEGIPTRYSRPGRALAGWVEWAGGGAFPQRTLVDMVQDGLLRLPAVDDGEVSFSRAGAILRSVAVGAGRDRYLPALEAELRAVASGIEALEEDEGGGGSEGRDRRRLLERRDALEGLGSVIEGLFEVAPASGGQAEVLTSASRFLDRFARHAGRFDEYASRILKDSMVELVECLEEGELAGFDPWAWLADLASTKKVEGSGPAPGMLYAAPLLKGGHSGRGRTFIVGMDEGRFPGSGRQDPLLLDVERARLTPELPTGASRLTEELERLAELFARLRGGVTLSFSCRSLTDDREVFPSPVLLSAYRVIERRDGDLEALEAFTGDPVSFAPASPDAALDMTDWWLASLCGRQEGRVSPEMVAGSFPNLGRGMVARGMRESPRFTVYDGYVPEAASECDPTREGARPLSASALEELARCPMDYFLHRVLRIEPLEEYEIDPSVWLDARQMGRFLHGCFRTFLERLDERGELPRRDAHLAELRELFDRELAYWRGRVPPNNEASYRAQARMLKRAAYIFLTEEEANCGGRKPAYFEASVGRMPAVRGRRGNEIDTTEPVSLELPGGAVILAHGQMDRVDELTGVPGGRRFEICDYKSGGTGGYDVNDPFDCGRHVQNILYPLLLQSRLDDVLPGATVEGFGYFFPTVFGRGERIRWTMDELQAGRQVLADLCEMLSAGSFPFTVNPGPDLRYSDFVPAYGDVYETAEQVRLKLEHDTGGALLPYRRLRASELEAAGGTEEGE